jgi:hypothetical protein
MLLGFRDGEVAMDVDRLARRAERPEFRAELERLGIAGLPALLAHETIPIDVVRAAALRGPIHSLYHPRLNFEAGRAFFVGQQGELPFTGYGEPAQVGAVNSLAHRYLENGDGADPEVVHAALASRSCYQRLPGCGAYAGAWSQRQPNSEGFRALAATLQGRSGPLFLPRMRALLGTPPADPKRRIRPAVAVDVTRLFMEEYAHGAPLDPGVLLSFWERCGLSQTGVDACKRGVRTAQRMMIGDAPPEPDYWMQPEIEALSPHAAPTEEKGDEAHPAEE